MLPIVKRLGSRKMPRRFRGSCGIRRPSKDSIIRYSPDASLAMTVSPPRTVSPAATVSVGRGWHEDVHPRSEFHQPDPLARRQLVPGLTRQTTRRASTPTTCRATIVSPS